MMWTNCATFDPQCNLMHGLLWAVTTIICITASTKEIKRPTGNQGSEEDSVEPDFETLVKDFWAWRLRESPEFATSLGINDDDDRLETFTVEAFKHRKARCESFVAAADRIDARYLSLDDATNLALLRYDLKMYVDGYSWIHFGSYNPMNILEGIHKDYTYWLSSMKFDSEETYRSYINRLRALVTQIHEQINLMRESIRRGTTYHRVSVETLPEYLEAMEYRVLRSPFYEPFNESLDYIGISVNKMEKIRIEGANVIHDHVLPAYRVLQRFLTHEYIPRTRLREGVNSLSEGEQYYRACLRWHLASDISPMKLHKIGQDSMELIIGKIDHIKLKSGYSGKLEDFMKHVNRANKFFYRTEDELLQVYEDMVYNRIPEKLSKVFYRSTLAPPIVQPMQFDGPTAVLMPGSDDGNYPAVFFVNAQEPLKRPKWEILATALHETIPGKYLQASYTQNQTFPNFRKWKEYRKMHSIPFQFQHNTAYTEGWALYAETLGYDLDLFSGVYEQFGQLHSELYNACEMVVDTGIHALGWSRSDAIDLLLRVTGVSRMRAEEDVDRIITIPGQAVAPHYGQLQMALLRRKSHAILGERFSLREFHHQVLRLGPVPMDILQRTIDRWLETIAPAADADADAAAAGNLAPNIHPASLTIANIIIIIITIVLSIIIHHHHLLTECV